MADQDKKTENKCIQKSLRVTQAQGAYLKEKSFGCGIGEAELLRRLIASDMGKSIQVQTQEEFLLKKQLVYEINRIGNNINQIVKNVNSHYYSDYEKKKLFAMMKKVAELMDKEKGGTAGE